MPPNHSIKFHFEAICQYHHRGFIILKPLVVFAVRQMEFPKCTKHISLVDWVLQRSEKTWIILTMIFLISFQSWDRLWRHLFKANVVRYLKFSISSNDQIKDFIKRHLACYLIIDFLERTYQLPDRNAKIGRSSPRISLKRRQDSILNRYIRVKRRRCADENGSQRRKIIKNYLREIKCWDITKSLNNSEMIFENRKQDKTYPDQF